jgi:hypothetical protein
MRGRMMGTKLSTTKIKNISLALITVLVLIFTSASHTRAEDIEIQKADIDKIYDAGYQSYYDGNWVAAYANLTFCYRAWNNYSNFFDSNLGFKEKLQEVIDYLKNHIQKCEPSSSEMEQYKHEMPSLPR